MLSGQDRKDHCHILGYQTPGTSASKQKERSLQPPVKPAGIIHKQLPHDQHVVGIAANVPKKMHLDQGVSDD